MNFPFNKGFFAVVIVGKDGRKRKSILNLNLRIMGNSVWNIVCTV